MKFLSALHNKINSQKGSTLLLAMVVVSTVLLAGVGTAVILSRQVREISTAENSAVALYMAQTIANGIANESDFQETNDFISIDLNWIDKELEYKAQEESAGEYLITIKVENDYYVLRKKVSDVDPGPDPISESLVIYFKNPDSWSDVTMHYAYLDGTDPETREVIKEIKENMAGSEKYPGSEKNTIEITEEVAMVQAFFCEGKKDEVGNCWQESGYYGVYEWEIEEDREFLTCTIGGSCSYRDYPHFFAFYRAEEDLSPFHYYENPSSWSDVTMQYAYLNSARSLIGGPYKDDMSGWIYKDFQKNEVASLPEQIAIFQAFFCKGKKDEVGNCWDEEDGTGRYEWEVDLGESELLRCNQARSCSKENYPGVFSFIKQE